MVQTTSSAEMVDYAQLLEYNVEGKLLSVDSKFSEFLSVTEHHSFSQRNSSF